MSAPSVAWPAGSAERPAALAGNAFGRLLGGVAATAQAELRKLRHDHVDVFTRSAQPLLWLFVFGTALHNTHAIAVGKVDYRAYITPGVMAQAALFIAIFFGLAVIWERDVGQVQGLRQMLVGVGGGGELWLDFLVVLGFLAAMVAAATRAYPRAIL